MDVMIEVTGHRGAAGLEPENTLRSIRKAIDLGVDRVEIDVRVTKDGYLVVIHDETVDRTTNGHGYVKDLTFSELRRLDAEIHTLAHRIEEDLMTKKGHPADRIVTLELHRAEFLSKMRDFVWTVRRLDRETKLFKLPSSSSNLFK